jgi:hypothetical protein
LCTNIIPPWAEESVVSASDLFGQDVDALVIKRRESAKQSIKDATKSPHIDTLAVPFVLHDFWCCIADCAARGHRLLIPNNLTQTKVGNLDPANASSADTRDELSLIFLVLVIRPMYWVLGGDDIYPFE